MSRRRVVGEGEKGEKQEEKTITEEEEKEK